MLRVLTIVALAGLVGSIAFHVLVIGGVRPPTVLIVALHLGGFVLAAFLAVLAFAIRLDEGDWWHSDSMALWQGCPFWLRVAGIAVVACVVLSAVINKRIETAVYSVLYAVFFTGFYSLMKQPWRLTGLLCPNGHAVSARNRFCKTCGIPMPKPVADD